MILVDKTFQWQARHTVLTILFVTWIVSAMDRMAMSVAIPYIAADFHLTPQASGLVMSVFYAGYAISQIPGGLLADRFGARRVATLAMVWWSAFTAITGAATNLIQMVVVRFVFGLGEGVFPACAFKTLAVWFPQQERATATAIMLASNPLGVALSPLAVVAIMSFAGWRAVFYALFLPGIVISVFFWIFIRDRPGGDARDPEPRTRVTLGEILRQPDVLKYFLVLFTFDFAFWGFTAWLPTYLVNARGFSMAAMGITASLPFFAGTLGSAIGGWISDRYFSNNRRVPLVASQLISAVLLYLTFTADSASRVVLFQTLAGLFFLSFFSLFWAMPVNTVPQRLMGVASGFINMAGQAAAFISPLVVGYLVGATDGNFDRAFRFLIISLLVSSALVLTISRGAPREVAVVAANIRDTP